MPISTVICQQFSKASKFPYVAFNALGDLHMQSVPITTNVVSSNTAHGGVYSIQHYVKKLVRNNSY
jgi:phosphatidylserine decarboxylase